MKDQDIRNSLSHLPTYRAGLWQSKAYRVLKHYLTEVLSEHDLSMQEWAVMGHLYDAKEMRHSAVSKLLGVESPLATTMVNRLASVGYVKRHPDPTDSRAKLVRLTPKGMKTVIEVERILRKDMKRFMSDIPAPDLAVYVRVLQKLSEKA